MKLAVIGTGYVGLVTAVCLAEKGHEVICIDNDEKKINLLQNGEIPIYEKNLEYLMKKNIDRLIYTSKYELAYKEADVIFIAVGTPEKLDGNANLNYLWNVIYEISGNMSWECLLVIKSNVPIVKVEKINNYLLNNNLDGSKFHIVSNPEFLSQGTAVEDTLNASRIIIGTTDKYAESVMLDVYKDFNVPKLITNHQSAEMIKYASNDFLALKISYINEIANLCEIIGANISDVTKGMAYDSRIGSKFLNAGVGYGGSCFPKDTKALHWMSTLYGKELKTIKAAIEVNEQQKFTLIKKAEKYYDSLFGKKVAVLGVTFKPGTDDLREAPSIVNINVLLDEGAHVYAYDPVGLKHLKNIYGDRISFCDDVKDALYNADICLIFTEWTEIKNLTYDDFKLMHKPVIIDGRNCFSLDFMIDLPVVYDSIGRDTIKNI